MIKRKYDIIRLTRGRSLGKKQESKADIVLKNYWSDNAQFTDLFNAVLFHGKQVIKPEELESTDTESSSILEHKGYAESLKASRDIIKVRKKSTTLMTIC